MKNRNESVPGVLPASLAMRVFLVVFGCLQTALASGLIYGWAGIAGTVLTASKVDGGAGLTIDETVRIFSTASGIGFSSQLLLGTILDCLGPRKCSIFSNVSVGVGCILFAVADSFLHFAAAANLIAFGGPGVQSSLIHLSHLFPERQNMITSLITCTVPVSFAIFPLIDWIWQVQTISFRVLFAGLGAVIITIAAVSIVIWPDTPFEVKTMSDNTSKDQSVPLLSGKMTIQPLMSYLRSGSLYSLDKNKPFMISNMAITESKKEEALPTVSLKDRPFTAQVSSGSFMRLTLFLLVTSFWANLYVGTVTTELGDTRLYNATEEHQLTRAFTLFTAFGIIGSPLVGFVMDTLGFAVAGVVTALLGVLQMILIMIHLVPSTAAPAFVTQSPTTKVFASFVCYSLFRTFLFPYFIGFLSFQFGFKYFGILSGIAFALCGAVQFFALTPVALWAEGTCHDFKLMDGENIVNFENNCDKGRWDRLHSMEIGSLLLLLAVPLLDQYYERQRMQGIKDTFGTPKTRSPSYCTLPEEESELTVFVI